MPYDVELRGDADRAFDQLATDLAICINESLHRLASDPLVIGRPAHFPYLPRGYIYDFWCDDASTDQSCYVVVFFDVDQTRRVVDVFGMTIRRLPRGRSGQ